MVIFHSYVNLPEGKWFGLLLLRASDKAVVHCSWVNFNLLALAMEATYGEMTGQVTFNEPWISWGFITRHSSPPRRGGSDLLGVLHKSRCRSSMVILTPSCQGWATGFRDHEARNGLRSSGRVLWHGHLEVGYAMGYAIGYATVPC